MQLWTDSVASPVGDLVLAAHDGALAALEFDFTEGRLLAHLRARFGAVTLQRRADPFGFASRLRAYLAGDLHALDDLPVDTGGTDFQRQVWAALRRVPVGTTTSYGRLAAGLGLPGAARAVGLANSQNPVAIVVPCHRVIGADGSLTGYAGGLHRKRWLLEHEGVRLQSSATQPALF